MKLDRRNIIKLPGFQYLFSSFMVLIAVLLLRPLAATENYHVVSFVLLFLISIMAPFMETIPILLASSLSAILWNYFFIPPNFTFHIDKTEDILIFGMFFIIAFVNGVFTTRVRKQEKLVIDREQRTFALFQLTQGLSKASGIGEVLKVATYEIKTHFHVDAIFVLQDGENVLKNTDGINHILKLKPEDFKIAQWSFAKMQNAGAFTGNFIESESTFYPLSGVKVNPGVVILNQTERFTSEQLSYWKTFLTQISNALEREFLGELAQRVRFLDESDRLYKTLFNSISHEFRIPVATIMGAADSMLDSTNLASMQLALCNEIFTASIRLNRLIENLLNMSRLESGHISARLDWYDVNDLINKVINDLSEELKPYALIVNVQQEMTLVKIDFGLMEQVLYNLLINSTQYAPPTTKIFLSIGYKMGNLKIKISDSGPGFPEKEIRHVFKKFFKVDKKSGGLGLGLSICKGFVEAHGGSIYVDNQPQGGALFTIQIPSEIPDIIKIQESDNE